MGVLYAKVDGQWVPISTTGPEGPMGPAGPTGPAGPGSDEVIISADTPANSPWELWYDPDAQAATPFPDFPRTYIEEIQMAAAGNHPKTYGEEKALAESS
jgi:hypothetical protein